MSQINVTQINQGQLTAFVQQYAGGSSFTGNMLSYVESSGWMGNTVVGVTGNQTITGVKRFQDSPIVPYYGGTGSAPSARWVNDQIIFASGGQTVTINQTGTLLAASIGQTGSNLLTLVVNMSGALTGQGGSTISVTGSLPISAPNFTGADAITITYNGTNVIVSGSSLGGGGGSPDSVTTTGTYIMAGTYVFSGSPFVPVPTQPSGAVNMTYVSGISGVLYGQMTGISGAIGTPTIINTGGNVTNISLSGITGNFVNMSFWFDQYSLITGLNQIEAGVGRDFIFTGYSLGCINTGTQGVFSGSFYQRTPTNAKTTFVSFGFPSGQFFSGRGDFAQTISGMNRVGLDIYLIGTGITGLSINAFGVGY